MMRTLLRSKISRATVTEANVSYEGSLVLDQYVMAAAGLVAYEKVEIYDVTNGSRFETFVLEGGAGTGEVRINGAAAHLVRQGDKVIIAYFCLLHGGQM